MKVQNILPKKTEGPEKARWSYAYTGLNRPLDIQEVEASRTSRQLAHEGGKAVSSKQRPPLPPEDIPSPYFC